MFLEEYRDFLLKRGKRPSTANTYSRKLRNFLDSGFSVGDLIGAADRLMEQYAPGGTKYDPKDHRNTVSALKQLNEFILADCIDTLYIRYVYPKSTIAAPDGIAEYIIENRRVILLYNNGKSSNKQIADTDYYALVKLMKASENDLSDESSLYSATPAMRDYSTGYYDYRFGDRCGNHCPSLFAGNKGSEHEYNLRIAKILS